MAFLAPYAFDFFYEHGTEPVQKNFLDGSTGLSIAIITIVLRRAAGQNILDPIMQTLPRAATRLAAPDSQRDSRSDLKPDRIQKSTAFHPTDVVNWRIRKYPQPHANNSVDEIALVYNPWTLLAKFRC